MQQHPLLSESFVVGLLISALSQPVQDFTLRRRHQGERNLRHPGKLRRHARAGKLPVGNALPERGHRRHTRHQALALTWNNAWAQFQPSAELGFWALGVRAALSPLLCEDYSLVIGAALLFATLATLMYVTRRVDWYEPGARFSGERPENQSQPLAG